MSGPSSERDRSEARRGASDRRRSHAAAGTTGSIAKGFRAIRRYVWNRKFSLIFLTLMVLLAFGIRTVWYYSAAYTGGPTPLLSGNDPDYHKRTVDHFIATHHFLQHDPLIDYPQGGPNPNPPGYSTSVALIGYLISPAFHFDLGAAVWFSMEIGAALWASLTVIPVYLFTKEMFGRKSGYFAALIIALMAGNIERTPLGFSDHDGFFMFFIVTGFFFFLKALRMVKSKPFVKSWRVPYDITLGLVQFGRTNKVAILYSAMAGMSLAVVALTWKGFSYAVAIIFVYLLFHMMLNKFRRIDNTGTGLIVLVAISVLMLVSLPYYMTMHFMNWYEAPAILYVAIVLVVAIFVLTRDLPWLLIIPVLLGLFAVILTVVYLFLPSIWLTIFSGAGYFIRTKLYGTIAEAQPPDINRLVFSYGLTTFFLALIGVFIMIKDMPKGWKNDHIFTTIWAIVSIYMAIAAIRFMYNATPVFAILSGWILWEIMKRFDYKKMFRVFRSMRGDLGKAFKYSVKVRHVAGIVFLAFLVIAPNAWNAVDAGIPYETKKKADLDVYNALPSIMRPPKALYDPTSNSLWYFGSFGTSFMNDYWADGMWWLRTQDDWLAEQDRPAFISWWDYGHWCTQVGKHPTAADNFQNGVEFAGNFIAAQGEKEAEALMALRIMQIEYARPVVRDYMTATLGEANATMLIDLFQHPSKYTPDIAKYPERYGVKDSKVSDVNTVFIVGTYMLETAKTEDQIVDMLSWFQTAIGKEFRYFAVDSRLMPLSYQNTGIFYAPITLSDNVVNEYIEVVAVYNGNQITLQQAAALTTAEKANLQYQLVWKKPFFDSMFYRCFIGYSGYDQGPDFKDNGIPILSGNLASSVPLPAWNMTHWKVVERTVHWNPWNETEVSKHPLDWTTISEEQAANYTRDKKGTVDEVLRTLGDGVIYIKYYAGAWINGTVTTEDGEPVPGALVTVNDDFRFYHSYYTSAGFVGIPHGTTTTDDQGRFSILAPFGNVTVVASSGGSLDYLSLHEKNILNETNVFITDDQAMRIGQYNISVALKVPTAHLNGTLYEDLNGNSKFDAGTDKAMDGAKVLLTGQRGLNHTYVLDIFKDGYFQMPDLLPGVYNVSAVYQGHTVANYTTLTVGANESKSADLAIPLGTISGTLTRMDGKPTEGTSILARDLQNNQTVNTTADDLGDYSFEKLLPGNWSVELYVPGTRPINETVVLGITGGQTLNLTLLPTAFVEGAVFRDTNGNGQMDPGEGVVNATISFTRLYGEDLIWTVVTNGTGQYNTSLPSGIYSTYVDETYGNEHWAALRTQTIDATNWSYALDLQLARAYRVNGTLDRRDPSTPAKLIAVGRSPIDLWTALSRVRLTSNATGVFGIYLPPGSYSFLAQMASGDRPIVNLTRVNVTAGLVDLGSVVLTNGTRLTGSVFFDINRNEKPDTGEGRGGVGMLLEAAGYTFNTTTLANGSYSIVAAPLNYTVSVSAAGFLPYTDHINATANLVPTGKNIKLQALNVSYVGRVGYDWDHDNNLSDDGFPFMVVNFNVDDPTTTTAIATKATADAYGWYTTSLAPGTYRVTAQLDRNETGGTYRYSYTAVLEVVPGTTGKEYNVWLDRLVPINGTVTIQNGTFDPENPTEFIRIDTGSKWIVVTSGAWSNYTKGNFSDYITVGNHTLVLELQKYNSTTYVSTTTHIVVVKMDFEVPTRLDLVAEPVVRFNGTVYYDKNQNGRFDAGEGLSVINFVLRGVRDETVYQQTNGSFEGYFYPNPNYTLLIQRVQVDNSNHVEYQYYHNATLDLTHDVEMYIPVTRMLSVSGVVFWDKNKDNATDAGEFLPNATVSFVSKADGSAYNITTDKGGQYRIYLPVDNTSVGRFDVHPLLAGYTPKQASWSLNLSLQNRTLVMMMVPGNVTLEGTAFLDLNGNGLMNRYEHPVPVQHITFWDTTNVSKRYDAEADVNGSFGFVIPPGTYDVHAWTPSGTGYLVNLGVVFVEPSGTNFTLHLPMTEGRTASGALYYINQTGQNRTAPAVNLTVTPLDGEGQIPILNSTNSTLFVVLPDGRYRVNGTFNTTQFGVQMRYDLDTQFRVVLKDRSGVDLNFTKIVERKLKLWWDNIPSLIDQNASVNYTIYAQNIGSENATFDLDMVVPTGWAYKLEAKNLTLNMSQSGHLWAVINASAKAVAGTNNLTLEAKPRGASDTPSKLVVSVNIKQVYGFEVTQSQGSTGIYYFDPINKARHLSFSLALVNDGNGRDIINLTHSTILNWNITFPNRQNITLEPYMSQPQIPIDILLPNATVLTSQTLTVTARSLSEPGATPKSIDLVITFPDLAAQGKTVKVLEKDKQVPQPKAAPGFGTIVVLAALGAATFLAVRRRRGWHS